MPLRIEVSVGEFQANIPDLQPGGPSATLTDHGETESERVIITCGPEDNGGVVATHPLSDEFVIGTSGLVEVNTDALRVEAIIPVGGVYVRGIRMRMGKGVLTVTHFNDPS